MHVSLRLDLMHVGHPAAAEDIACCQSIANSGSSPAYFCPQDLGDGIRLPSAEDIACSQSIANSGSSPAYFCPQDLGDGIRLPLQNVAGGSTGVHEDYAAPAGGVAHSSPLRLVRFPLEGRLVHPAERQPSSTGLQHAHCSRRVLPELLIAFKLLRHTGWR